MATLQYTKILVKTNAPVEFKQLGDIMTVTKEMNFSKVGKLKPINLKSYKPREDQFCNGTATRQKEILNMMIQPGIIKGLKNYNGIRYLVDGFKSFVEASYKYQFGELIESLDTSNKFVRAIINEPFIEDLEKSTNPLFKETLNGPLELRYLVDGGNRAYSTMFLTKFQKGANKCFFYGSGVISNKKLTVPAGKISNLFISKSLPFDVIANTTGYIDNVSGIEINPDDDERGFMEKVGWNPIINIDGGFTIYGNLTGTREKSALQQIHISELLAYIQETLSVIGKKEAFKGTSDEDYLQLETTCQSFMDNLVLTNAIEPNPIVICNSRNNTKEIRKQKIKLIHIEFTPLDAADKVVFDLTIN